MSDWQVPGASGDARRDDRPGGAPRPTGPQQSAPWSAPGPSAPPPVGSRPVIPLRPLGLGDVLAGAFTVFRRNARVLLLWSVLLSGVLGLLSTLASTFGQQALQSRVFRALDGGTDGDSIVAGSITLWLVLSAGLPFLAYLGRAFLVAPVAADTGQRVLGRRATFRGLWALLAGRRRSVVAWILLQLAAGAVVGVVFVLVLVAAVAALVGGDAGAWGYVVAVLLVVLGAGVLVAWLDTKFAFTVPTIALEGRTVFAAAAQSWRLTRGAFWRTFGIRLLVTVVFGFAVSIASTPLTIGAVFVGGTFDPLGQTGLGSGAGAGATVAVVVGSLLAIAVQCITDVLGASVTTFLAIDRRIRTEALDQRIAAHLQTGQPADPFAPADPVARPPWPGQGWPGQPGPGQGWPGQGWPGQPAPGQGWSGQPGPGQPGQGWPGQPGPARPGAAPSGPWGGAPGPFPPDGRT
jgi:hypothetical protein